MHPIISAYVADFSPSGITFFAIHAIFILAVLDVPYRDVGKERNIPP